MQITNPKRSQSVLDAEADAFMLRVEVERMSWTDQHTVAFSVLNQLKAAEMTGYTAIGYAISGFEEDAFHFAREAARKAQHALYSFDRLVSAATVRS